MINRFLLNRYFCLFFVSLLLFACNSYNPKKREPGILYDVDLILPSTKTFTGKWEYKNFIIYFDRAVYDTLIKYEYNLREGRILLNPGNNSNLKENEFIKRAYDTTQNGKDTLYLNDLDFDWNFEYYEFLKPKNFIYDRMMESDFRIYNKTNLRFEDTIVLWDRDYNLTTFFLKNGTKIIRFREPKSRVKF